MTRPSSTYPTELELQILKLLWEQSPMTVRAVRDGLADAGRDLAHTSVITTLGTMVEKRQLKRLKPLQGKAYRFEPLIDQDRVSRGMVGDLVDRVFDGSAEAMMLSLFESSDLDAEEIKRLRKLFNQKVKEQQQ